MNKPAEPDSYLVYGDIRSGNCYKVAMLMAHLRIPYRWVAVDVVGGGARTAGFLSRNPVGKVPLLELPDGRFLSESNAILNYLAEGSEYLPEDPYRRALVLQWQFFEQYSHEPYIATSRFIMHFLGNPVERRADLERYRDPGHKALRLMDTHLGSSPFMAGDSYTIADMSLYAYTHVAHEGGFALDDYAHLRDWLGRVSGQAGFLSMAEAERRLRA